MKDNTSTIASKVLGEKVSAPLVYDNTILVPIPREANRLQYNITNADFGVGYDVWNCYEISFMTENGLPVSGYARIVYNSNSKYIIESKSLKLYLNSFNMTPIGSNSLQCLELVTDIIQKDLSLALETDVQFQWFGTGEGYATLNVMDDFAPLESIIDLDCVKFSEYEETPELLIADQRINEIKVSSNLLRSNCRVTNQPDWGTVLIDMTGDNVPSLESLAKYLVSFRNESHFHEECVEMIYIRLKELFNPDTLTVTALYTRRGGIDICPVRSLVNNTDGLLSVDPLILNARTIQQ